MTPVDKLALRGEDGWYVIERAEHDGRSWLEKTEYGHSYMHSARFSDADVEGTGSEMHAIAAAIEGRTIEFFKRCSVDATSDPVRFSSPRNSQTEGLATRAAADDLAKQIRATVKP